MNKPQQNSSENYMEYERLFTPLKPFQKYILYCNDLSVYLEPDKIGLFGPFGSEIKDFFNNRIRSMDKDLKIFLDFDTKIFSLIRKGDEILRLNFDHYILMNNYHNWDNIKC